MMRAARLTSMVQALARNVPGLTDNLRGRARWVARAIEGEVEYKTVDAMFRMIWRAVRELYNNQIGYDAFIDRMSDILPQQLRKAWNAGMRVNGLDPQRDMTPEWEAVYQEYVIGQFAWVDRLASDIVAARVAQSGTDALRVRANMWANRYNECRDLASITTSASNTNYVWVLGEAEHCDTCLAIAGTVASAAQWEMAREAGLFPKSPKLQCRGYNCKCRLERTDKRRSPKAIDAIITQALLIQ